MKEKITRPSAEGCYFRERLFTRLDEERSKPVIWVSGPGGSGKTELVSSYIESRGLENVWYQVDQGDADVASFFYYLSEADRNCAPEGINPLPLLTPDKMRGLSAFTFRFFEKFFERMVKPGLLVLDSFHEVPEHTPFQRVVIDGISRVPKGLSVVILSRRDPPPAFSRLRASRRVIVIGKEELNFTKQEFVRAAGVLGGKSLSPEVIEDLHLRLEGWISGLILILEQARLAGSVSCPGPGSPTDVFDFFAGEVWSRTSPEVRDFLLKTAFLQVITPQGAEELTGINPAGRILSHLCDSNLFTLRLNRSPERYRYHSMFREFLVQKAEETFDKEGLRELQARAAAQLLCDDQLDAAAALFISAERWDDLRDLILQVCEAYVLQGRCQTLAGWLEVLPAEHLTGDPWLQYWRGICAFQTGRSDSRRILIDAHESFSTVKDAKGMWLSWSAIMGFFPYKWENHHEIDQWIDRFFRLYSDLEEFPTKECELQAVHGILWAMVFLRPFPEEIGLWVQWAKHLLEGPVQPDYAITLANAVLCYLTWGGRMQEAGDVIKLVRPSLDDPDISPMPRLLFQAWLACMDMLRGDTAGCIEKVEEGLKEADLLGIGGVEANMCAQAAYAALSDGDTVTARRYLERYRDMILPSNHLHECQAAALESWLDLSLGDLQTAALHAGRARQIGILSGSPFFEAAGRLSLIHVMIEEGRDEGVEEEAARILDIAQRMDSRHVRQMGQVALACLYLKIGDDRNLLENLKGFCTAGKEGGLFNAPMWRPAIMSRLCARALEAGIEEDYVREFIRRRGCRPEGELFHLENWPWPLKIYTLGRFCLVLNGEPVRFSGKVQQRPLDLLKALISFGGKDVSSERLVDALWPESEGDTARKAFDIALYRLRKLLRVKDVVQLREGMLSLNTQLAWVDVWAFEKAFDSCQTTSEEVMATDAFRTLELFAGPFLPTDESKVWTVALREKTRSRYLRMVGRIGTLLSRRGDYLRAKEHYVRALDFNPLSEDLYRNLMVCYEKMNQKGDAIAVYNRCRKTISAAFGLEPSAETKAIYRSLRS